MPCASWSADCRPTFAFRASSSSTAIVFFHAEDGIRVLYVTGVQTCALPICNDALARLGRLAAGRKALADALLAADSPDAAWTLARTQEPFVAGYDAAPRQRLFDQACDYLEIGRAACRERG